MVDWDVCPHLSRIIFLKIESEIISRCYSILCIGRELGRDAMKVCYLEIGSLKTLLNHYLSENPILLVEYLLSKQLTTFILGIEQERICSVPINSLSQEN